MCLSNQYQAELKRKLLEAGVVDSPALSDNTSMNGIRVSPMDRQLDALAPPRYSLTTPTELPEIALPMGGLTDVARGVRSTTPASAPRSATGSPETPNKGVESLLQLFATGWNPDLPDPREMDHLYVLFSLYGRLGANRLLQGAIILR